MPLSEWTEADVDTWLSSRMQLAPYGPVFAKFGIDGKVLQRGLNTAHFDEMGITSAIVRVKILAEVDHLISSSPRPFDGVMALLSMFIMIS